MDRPVGTEPRSPRQVENGRMEKGQGVVRRFPSLPSVISVDSRPVTVRKGTPQWSSNTETSGSKMSAPMLKFRELPSLTVSATRSTALPFSVSRPSSRTRPQLPSLSGPASRPKPTVGSNLTPPNDRSKPESLLLTRPIPKEIAVTGLSGPTERPQPVSVEREINPREYPEPYRMEGVNRAIPPLPFQVSLPQSRPDLPASSPLSSSQRERPAEVKERSLPDRREPVRSELPRFTSVSAPDRAEPAAVSSQRSGELGQYRPNGVSPPQQRAKPIGGTGPSRTLPSRSLRVSDL